MSHFHIDGTITVAKLKRGLLGGAVYTDVTVRQDDGDQRRVGTLMVLTGMKQAMTPGTRGRFYFHDVLGTKGIHGFRPVGGQAHVGFPGRWEGMFLTMGLLNLSVVAGWLMLEGSYAWFAGAFALMCLIMAGLFAATRSAALRAWRADDPRVPSAGELRAAMARG